MAGDPLGPQFQQEFQGLLHQYDFPQGSVAVIQDGQAYTYGATNSTYPFSGPAPAAPAADSLFRVASLTKTITAMAILKLVQDGQIGLNDSALGDLGYTSGETISGRDPSSGNPISATIDPELLQITIQDLLQMTSGLVYNIPEASAAFPTAQAGDVTTSVPGSYAALGFAPAPGGGAYTAPASMAQMVNYVVYEVSAQPSLMTTAPGSSYFYNNLNYGILSLIVAKEGGVSSPDPATQYWDYVDSRVLAPLGISPAGVGPAQAAMVGPGSTLQQDAYPTEVQYYPQAPLQPSIFPDPSNTLPGDLPEPPTTGLPLPYGGGFSLESLFGVGGAVATPTAMAILLNNLNQVYAGTAGGPLTRATVQGMVAPPINPATGQMPTNTSSSYWFGEGLDILPSSVSGTSWQRFGSLAGTSSLMERFNDGTILVATFNAQVDNDPNGYVPLLQQIATAALYTPPVANGDGTTTPVNTQAVITVLANDTDPNSAGALNPASVTIVAAPDHGVTSVNPTTGAVTYTPAPGFSSKDQFRYAASDNYGLTSNTATVTVQVATPQPPVANDDNAVTPGNTPVTIPILANDTDPNAGGMLIPSTVVVVAAPGHGSTVLNTTTGAVTYTPAAGFAGTDQFSYTVSDNFGLTSNVATVNIQVTASPPIANNDSTVTTVGKAVVINVLANDTDPNPGGMLNPASVVVVTGPGHGSTSLNTTTGAITYTPTPGFAGIDQFTYTVTDNYDQISNAATVTIQVNPPVYSPPVANDDRATTSGTSPVTIDVLANDTDPNAGGMLIPSSVVIVTGPSHGSTALDTSDGDVTYTPTPGFTGTDQFTYTVSDNFGLTSNVATVTIVVTATAPVANDDTATTPANTPVVIDVLANDTDPNPGGVLDPATVTIVTPPSHGSESINPTTGAITYTPDPGFLGTDQFSYTVSDNFGLTSNVATVTIVVTSSITATGSRFQVYPGLPLNDVPIATFTDTNLNLSSPPSLPQPTATINWGDGQTSSGTVSGPDANGVYTVTADYTYPTAFTSQLVPGTALPVTVTIADAYQATATANSAAVLLSTGTGTPFTGHLAATPGNGPDASSGYATTRRPTFSGTAPPFSIIQLFEQSVLPTAATMPSPLIQVEAGQDGAWSAIAPAGSLSDGVYIITATVTIPGIYQSGPIRLANDGQIAIETAGPSVASNPASIMLTGAKNLGQVSLVFDAGFGGMNLSNLLRKKNYRFYGPGLAARHPRALALGGSRIMSDGTIAQTLLLTLKLKPKILEELFSGKRTLSLAIVSKDYVPRGSGTTVNIGVTDQAGNPLQGGVVTIGERGKS